MPAKTTDPTIPIVIGEGAGTSGSHSQTLYFDLSAAPTQYLKLTDCPAALEKLNCAIAPLAKLSLNLHAAMAEAEGRQKDVVEFRFSDPMLHDVLERFGELPHLLVPAFPDPARVPDRGHGLGDRLTVGVVEVAPKAGNRDPNSSPGKGRGDPGSGQAADNIRCPHCDGPLQLLKAPGS
jgi:hypothetical protein